MLYPELVVKQGKTFTSLSGKAFSVSASHNYCGIKGRFKAVKISYCPDVSKYGRKAGCWAGRAHLSLKGKIVGKPAGHLQCNGNIGTRPVQLKTWIYIIGTPVIPKHGIFDWIALIAGSTI